MKVDLDKIKKSIEILKEGKVDYEFRITVVPSVHTKEDIAQLAEDIAPAKNFFLQAFRAEKTINPQFEKIRHYSKEFLQEIKKEIFKYFEICEIRE